MGRQNLIINSFEILAVQTEIISLQNKVNNLLTADSYNSQKDIIVPEVYVSPEEACRMLDISNPTLKSIVELGLIDIPINRLNKRDKYSLKEILWLQTQPFRGARKETIAKILKNKLSNFEFE